MSRDEAIDLYQRAALIYREGRADEAMALLRRIERTGPPATDLRARVLLHIAHIHHKRGKCTMARRYYHRALAVLPSSSSLRPNAQRGATLAEECERN